MNKINEIQAAIETLKSNADRFAGLIDASASDQVNTLGKIRKMADTFANWVEPMEEEMDDEDSKTQKWDADKVCEVLAPKNIPSFDDDLDAAVEYLNGPRLCRNWDVLSGWVRMIVEECEKEEKAAK